MSWVAVFEVSVLVCLGVPGWVTKSHLLLPL